jgi:pilus assembly protein Flp/PilA
LEIPPLGDTGKGSGVSKLLSLKGRIMFNQRETAMKNFAQSIKRFLVSEDGPTAVEYAVMLALIVIVCLTAIQAIGTNANTKFEQVRDALT